MKRLLSLIFFLSINTIITAQNPVDSDSLYTIVDKLILEKKYEKALELSLDGLNLKPNDTSHRVKWLNQIGLIFYNNASLNKALQYYQDIYKINTNLNDSLELMSNHISLANIYHKKLNDYEINSPKFNRYKDSALFYYLKNTNEFSHLTEGNKHKLLSHYNLTVIYSNTNDLEKAEFHINKAISGYTKLKQYDRLDGALINKGLVYIYKKKFEEAEKIYLKILKTERDTSAIRTLEYKQLASGNLSYIYKETSQFKKAYEFSKLKEDFTNKIYNKQKKAEITAIEARYNEQKARQEEALKTEKEREKKERFQLWFAIATLGAILIFLLGTILYRNSKLKAKNLSLALVRKELDQQREIQSLQKQHQNKIINATLDGREKERKDIAQALHDSVSSLLSSANLHLQVGKRKSPEAQNEIEKSQNIISEASDKIRDLSHQLISAVLLKFGLEYAVDNLCEKYSNEDLLFELETEDRIPRFEQAFEIKIHNIIEEFCNNIIKHSKATNASIRLHMEDNTIHITVKDNGVGFDTKKLDPKSGIGLSQIKARIESLEGEIDIQSITNKGTEINIKTPVLLA